MVSAPPSAALVRLLAALLCALGAFLGAPAPSAAASPAPAVTTVTAEPSAPDPHLSAAATVELPAVVEQSVRFPAPPVAPPVLRTPDPEPVRGRVAGDPRRERAPPSVPYDLRAPRGPPSTRHS
ncbi:hypothetical protein [Streptomyces sp. NPDC058955]|uniref:hypothetical protein n=1 Tax=unclassified Streptomyces TaxID=2593676 RepID=UPI003648157C